jgi:large subunit ribosomal protein L22
VPGVKTNERPGTRAVLKHYRMSATKARQVLDLIRDKDVETAEEILRATPREAARVVSKVLTSAVANARHNDQLDPEELYVAACYADEGATLKRWRPRARGRASRVRKRMCHITVIVARLPEDRLERRRATRTQGPAGSRARRVAASRGDEAEAETGNRATRRARARGIPVEGDEEAEEATDETAEDAVAEGDEGAEDDAAEDTESGDVTDEDETDVEAEADDDVEVEAEADDDTEGVADDNEVEAEADDDTEGAADDTEAGDPEEKD